MFADLRGKVAVVTGAAGAIAGAAARGCAAQGMRVTLIDRAGDALAATAETLAAGGADVISQAADVTDEDAMARAVAATREAWGGVDVLIAGAGAPGARRPAHEGKLADWRRTLEVNLTGTYVSCRAVLADMLGAGRGAIVNVGSTAGRTARINEADYCAAKAGVEQLTRALAAECAPYGVRVNAVCPGATDTPFIDAAARAEGIARDDLVTRIVAGDLAGRRVGIPLGRLAAPGDLVGPLLFLCSDAARHVTGQVLYVDGGESIL